jgi:hypothetical protein
MRILILATAVMLASASAHAACIGSGTLSTCYDNNGNTYTVQRLGDSTFVNGHNSNTGSSWSQNSQTVGNSTFTNGTDADGNAWNMQQQRVGNSTLYSGRDSDGNSFSGTCGVFGCN